MIYYKLSTSKSFSSDTMAKVSQLTLIFRDKLQTLNQTSTKDSDVVSLKPSCKYHYNHARQQANIYASWPAFQIPVHYPNFTKEQYEVMSEEELVRLFKLYGMPTGYGDLSSKRQFAIGAFLWEKELDSSTANHEESVNPNPPADDSGESSLMGLLADLKHMVHNIFRV